jgi:uncharacterized membrane protein YcgQ (UPF0703/DUF1980 family)
VTCCLADAVAVGLVIEPAQLEPLDQYVSGQWVKVYGRLQPINTPLTGLDDFAMKGIFFTSIHQDYVFKAEMIEEIPTPEYPPMFEFQQQEPYAY